MTITTTAPPRLALRPGITMHDDDDGIVARFRTKPVLRIRGASAGLAAALTGPDAGPVRLQQVWEEFDALSPVARRCLLPSVHQDGVLLAVAESLRADVDRVEAQPVAGDALIRLNKFAYTRGWNDELLLESPTTGMRLIAVDPRVAALAGALAAPHRVERITVPGLDADAIKQLLALMAGTGFVESAADPADPSSFPSAVDPVQQQWDFHDLLFHSRSRFGRTTEPFGGVFPYVGRIEATPPIRGRHAGAVVPLPLPDFDLILEHDPAVLLAMETRHSVRTFGEEPLTVEQLGEFLFRTCRIRDVYGPRPGMPYQATKRPYPTGGAAYELEVYVTICRVAGLEAGSYHYEPDAHRLRRLGTTAEDRARLVQAAALSAGGELAPDALLTVTSRFQRLQWKYRSIAYAVSLKHVGVLYQTMYLVASAMRIGACGLGSGDSDLSVRAFGLDYLVESSVGEFVIGSAPDASRSLEPMVEQNCATMPGADWVQRAAATRAAGRRR